MMVEDLPNFRCMSKKFFGDVLKLETRGSDSFLEGDHKETLR